MRSLKIHSFIVFVFHSWIEPKGTNFYVRTELKYIHISFSHTCTCTHTHTTSLFILIILFVDIVIDSLILSFSSCPMNLLSQECVPCLFYTRVSGSISRRTLSIENSPIHLYVRAFLFLSPPSLAPWFRAPTVPPYFPRESVTTRHNLVNPT